jgi:hypothetical protein
MSFSQLIQRVRAARQGGAYPAQALLWLDDGEDPDAKIDAERAAGRIGQATKITFVGWLPAADPENALPVSS